MADIYKLIENNSPNDLVDWKDYNFPKTATMLELEKLYEEQSNEERWLVGSVIGWLSVQEASAGSGNKTAAERKASYKRLTSVPGNKDTLRVRYIAIGKQIDLPGHLMHFKDDYSPKWKAEEVYGRMDPIITYQGTPRKITLAWEVDAPGNISTDVAGRVGDLIKFLYPVYEDSGTSHSGTGTMTAAPLLRISMITNSVTNKDKKGLETTTGSSFMGGKTGFLIAVDSFDIEKYTAAGGQDFGVKRLPAGGILPIKYTITIGGVVFHEDAKPGWVWTKKGKDGVSVSFGTKMAAKYPYGQRGAVDTYRTPEQAIGGAKPELPKGSPGAQAVEEGTDSVLDPLAGTVGVLAP